MRPLLFSILIMFITTACETVVEVDVPHQDVRLVVNAILEQDSTITFRVWKSISPLVKDEYTSFGNSNDVILFKDGVEISDLYERGGGISKFVSSKEVVEAGSKYGIRVSIEGYEAVEAETYIRNPVPITKVTYDTTVVATRLYDQQQGAVVVNPVTQPNNIQLTLEDPTDEDNYYEIVVMKRLIRYVRSGNINEGIDTVEYERIRQLAFLSSDDPVFSSQDDLLLNNNYFFNNSLMFSDETFNGEQHTISFKFNGMYIDNQDRLYYEDEKGVYFIVLRTLSRDQYLYYQSLDLQRQTEGNPFAEPVPIYNNIVGGYGIFAGFSQDMQVIDFTN